MGYFDDFGESKSKIPYDDIPINRNEKTSRGFGSFFRNLKFSKVSTIVLSLVVALNLVLSCVCIYLVNNTKNRTIYNNIIQI